MHRTEQRGLSVPAVLIVIAILTIVAIVLVIALNAMATRKARGALSGWDESLGTWDEVMVRFPATEANSAALELERVSASLGNSLAPRRFAERARPATEAAKAFARLKKEVFHPYAVEQIQRRRRGEIDPPPEALVDFIETYNGELNELRRLLLTLETPIWESDATMVSVAPLPNLLGHIDTHKLLNSVAVAQLHAGDTAGALEQIEASFNLARSLRDSPNLISQLIYIAVTRLQVGTLRHVRDLPAIWIDRLTEHDARRSLITALKYQGWGWMHADTLGAAGTEPVLRRIAAPFTRPYEKLCVAEMSEDWRQRMTSLEGVGALCDYDLPMLVVDKDDSGLCGKNTMALAMPNILNAVQRLGRLEVDLELLRLSMEADTAHRSGGGWPTPDGDRRPSPACPRDQWVYRSVDEDLEIAMSRELVWPGQAGPLLPPAIVLE